MEEIGVEGFNPNILYCIVALKFRPAMQILDLHGCHTIAEPQLSIVFSTIALPQAKPSWKFIRRPVTTKIATPMENGFAKMEMGVQQRQQHHEDTIEREKNNNHRINNTIKRSQEIYQEKKSSLQPG